MPRGFHMKTGRYKNGEKTRFVKGQSAWNKGKRFEYKSRPKSKGRLSWNKGTKGLVKPNKGTFGYGRSTNPQDHPRWKGGISKDKGYGTFMSHKRKIMKRGNGGTHTFADWETLKAQYNWRCPSCKKQEPDIKLTKDHIIPITKGGSDNIENIQPLCGKCNSKKYNKVIKYKL